jgi:hypothetical protein
MCLCETSRYSNGYTGSNSNPYPNAYDYTFSHPHTDRRTHTYNTAALLKRRI